MIKKVVLGGGCFWGMQDLIRNLDGIVKTTVGYSGGKMKNPTYEDHEGHAEVVEVVYDTDQTSLEAVLDFFFRVHDPTTINRQGNDTGTAYRSVMFYDTLQEKRAMEKFIEVVNKSGKWKYPVATTLERLEEFYVAEEYHQDYLQKTPKGYTCHYVRFGSYVMTKD